MPTKQSAPEVLAAQRARFRAFLTKRLGDQAAADDLLQDSLIKAFRSADSLKDNQKLTAWFYRVLRHAIIDHVRSRNATRAREGAWTAQQETDFESDTLNSVCGCFEALLPQLKPREVELLRRVELGNSSVTEAARALGMTSNNASVTLHRARNALRRKLEQFCGSCADGSCLDCDCADLPITRN